MFEKLLLGFDIGGTKLGIGLGDSSGKILGSIRLNNINTDPKEVLPQMAAKSRQLAKEAGVEFSDIAAFGISAPFPADAVRGIMIAPPNNPKWRNVPVLDYLRNELRLPGCFENDANCGALAEWFFGAGKGCHDFIYLTMSTGIGGGIIASDKLVRGSSSRSAGELGHICLQLNGRQCACGLKGCYEAYCGGRAVAMRMRQELRLQPESMIMQLAGGDEEKIDMRTLETAFRANDPYAKTIWEEIALRNAQAFGLMINTFNPEKLVLGTIAWSVGEIYIDPILKHLDKFCWPELCKDCTIAYSQLRREISSYAGIAAALNFLNER